MTNLRVLSLAAITVSALGACASGNDSDNVTAPRPDATPLQPTTTEAEMTERRGDVPETSVVSSSTRPTAERPPVSNTTEPTTTTPPTSERGGGIDKQLKAAIDDLVARRSVDPSEVKVIVDEPVTWSDGSLGCPRPGMTYTQALVPGRRIVLQHDDGVPYSYHAADGGEPFYCPLTRVVAPTPRTDI